MKYTKSFSGYYYKVSGGGKKTRVSKEEYDKQYKEKKSYKQLGYIIIPKEINRNHIKIVENPIDYSNILWLENNFTKKNQPGLRWQIRQKRYSLKYVLEKGKGVIDCGAHIGDYGIPLAIALRNINRSDIMVYCIDPSKEKCEFMKNMCILNNLDESNIKIIHKGLADKKGKYRLALESNNTVDVDAFNKYGKKAKYINNTGGWQWIEDNNGIDFTTLDELYKSKIIDEIGFFWMDVQWTEYNVIKGGKNYFKKSKPYILMEYEPPVSYYNNGIVKLYKQGTREDLKKDTKYMELFDELGIKISKKGTELNDILLEFK